MATALSSTSLLRTEAESRAALLQVTSYDVGLDLTRGAEQFGSRTIVRFTSQGGPTFVDLKPHAVQSLRLNGEALDPETLHGGRLPINTVPGGNELVVEATMGFRNDGEGLHRSVDPADGKQYVYGMSFMDAAPSIFACFDQPDLKAPYTFHVLAPQDWVVIGNGAGEQVEPGVWEFATTQPLSTYFVTLVAGPYHLIRDEHDGIPLGLSARASIAASLEADAGELLTLTRRCFDEFHRIFGIRYPFGEYHQAFVPEFNAGAMENPGCVTFRDPMIFTSRVTRGARIQRAATIAHEMAHQWFGNIVTPRWWDDLWLNESFAEYLGNRVTADVTEFGDAWTHHAYARRQWGLAADQRPSTHPVAGNGALDAAAALQDFDGISYAKGSSVLKQLNTRLGDTIFFDGVIDHLTRHRFGNATMHDLFASWERSGAGELRSFTEQWLRTAGPDRIEVDRAAGVLRRTPPVDHPADRAHDLRVAVSIDNGASEPWQIVPVHLSGAETPFPVSSRAVVLDPYEDTWALALPDQPTIAALGDLLPRTAEDRMRAGIWNNLRSGFHQAALDPAEAIDLVVAALPGETYDDAVSAILPWAITEVAPLAGPASLPRLHAAATARCRSAEAGSTLQLSAFQAAARSASQQTAVDWLAGNDLPSGVELDLDLRWLLLVRLAVLGAVDRDRLTAELAKEPTARSQVEHTRALASLPDPQAKAYAWERFTRGIDVPNYELVAAGTAMWRPGQELVTDPYVERYFADLGTVAERFSGWVLADVVAAFFPRTSLKPSTVDRSRAIIADPSVDPGVRRRLVDATDDLERRLRIAAVYPAGAR